MPRGKQKLISKQTFGGMETQVIKLWTEFLLNTQHLNGIYQRIAKNRL